jgi:hypothetical protein
VASHQAEIQALSLRLDATLARHHSVVQQAETERAAAATEREALQAHLRQAEDRAYAEVDRLRQELKAAKAQLAAQARDHAVALRTADQALRAAQVAQHKAERDTAAAQAWAQVLERQREQRLTPPAKTAAPPTRRRAVKGKSTPGDSVS